MGTAMSAVEQLLSEALKLPTAEREQLTEELVKSIQPEGTGPSQDDYREAWSAELARRIEAADRGDFAEGDWRNVMERARREAET
jgi:putative addiction module component (TIGR02574 family)